MVSRSLSEFTYTVIDNCFDSCAVARDLSSVCLFVCKGGKRLNVCNILYCTSFFKKTPTSEDLFGQNILGYIDLSAVRKVVNYCLSILRGAASISHSFKEASIIEHLLNLEREEKKKGPIRMSDIPF